ncbi:hypothetical protein TL16_g06410, partial [Triparma laevis f. inornata]
MLDEHKETTGDLTSQLEAAALLLEERTKELERRNTELEASRGDNVIFHKELMTGKEKITELNAKIDEKDREITHLNVSIERLQKTLNSDTTLEKGVKRLNLQIQDHRDRKADELEVMRELLKEQERERKKEREKNEEERRWMQNMWEDIQRNQVEQKREDLERSRRDEEWGKQIEKMEETRAMMMDETVRFDALKEEALEKDREATSLRAAAAELRAQAEVEKTQAKKMRDDGEKFEKQYKKKKELMTKLEKDAIEAWEHAKEDGKVERQRAKTNAQQILKDAKEEAERIKQTAAKKKDDEKKKGEENEKERGIVSPEPGAATKR